MIKFTMNAKELKTMMDKAMTVVNKKASVPSLKRLYFSIDDKGILKILSTDIEHYVEARTENTYHFETTLVGKTFNYGEGIDGVIPEAVLDFVEKWILEEI